MIFQKSACIETLYTELPFLERFRAARADGFEFVEFWSWTDKDLAAVKAAAAAAGVGISGFNGDAELSLIDPAQKTAYRAFLRRSLDAAVRIGAHGPSRSTPTVWGREEGSFAPMTTSATP